MPSVNGTKVMGATCAADAIAQVGADFSVSLQDVYRLTADGVKAIPGRRVIVRDDTGTEFGVVSERYALIQNAAAFEFFDRIVSEGLAEYTTAGIINGGERVWCQASMPGGFTIPGTEDRTEPYAMLTTTHDGSGACQIIFGAVRLFCSNRMRLARRQGRTAWSIRHMGNPENAIRDARNAMEEAAGLFKVYQERAHALAAAQCSREDLDAYLLRLIPDNKTAATTNARTENIRREIASLAHHGQGNSLPGIRGTWWAALNGVTEYVDHRRSARGQNAAEKAEGRFDSAEFGSGASMKENALELALEMSST